MAPQQIVVPPVQDIWTTSVFSYAPGGGGPGGGSADDVLRVGGWGDLYYSLLKFDLTGLPEVATDVELRMYDVSSNGGSSTPLDLYQITQDWNWQTQGTGVDHERLWWADQPSAVLESVSPLPAPTAGSYYNINITTLYNEWQSGALPNYGLELRPTSNNNNFDLFASSRNANPEYRPALMISTAQEGQTFIGGPGDDLLSGTSGNDRLSGGTGADILTGGDGNDWMGGGRGHDVLFGDIGADTMQGGADDDIYYVDDAGDVVIEGKNAGADEVRSSISFALGSYAENLVLNGAVNGTGNRFDNHITGSDDANVLNGGIGRDVLEGGGSDDVLTGGRDSDVFVFKPHFGHDVIIDFAVMQSYSAIGPNHDVLEFGSSIFADAAALFAHSADTSDGVLITANDGDSVLLENATLAMFQAHPEDFHFV